MGLESDQNKLRPPEKLKSSHQIASFDSGNTQLDDWLKHRALKNELDGASRTYVLCTEEDVAIAYYRVKETGFFTEFLGDNEVFL